MKISLIFSKTKSSTDNISIFRNFFHIGTIKFVNIFSKYLLISYLVRILGEQNYGVITWIDSFIQYFLVIVNFGFDLYIAKNIVEHKEDKEKVNEIISSVYNIKSGLFLLSLLLLVGFVFLTGIEVYFPLIILMMFTGVGEILFPIWYFQGIEKMKSLSIVTLISRGFLVLATFLFVTDRSHVFRYVVLVLLSSLVWGGFGFYFLKKEADFKFRKMPFKVLVPYLKEGYLFFLGKFSTLFLNFGTIFLIGFFCSKSLVSGFDLASKIIFVVVFLYEIVQQAVFPSIVKGKRKQFMRKLVLATFILGSFVALAILYFAENIMVVFGGVEMAKYAYLLEHLVILIPVIGLTNILGSCGLVAFGAIKQYNYSLLISCMLYIIMITVLYGNQMLSFANLVFVRIFVDVIMALLIIFFSVRKRILVN